MGLGTDILSFYNIIEEDGSLSKVQPRTFKDFIERDESLNLQYVRSAFQMLINEGYLVSIGYKLNRVLLLDEMFVSLNFNEEVAKYGEYDFIVGGGLSIREHFRSSVRPIIVTKSDGSLDIGTGFLMGSNDFIVTAKHVIEGMDLVQILDDNNNPIHVKSILISDNENIDLALITIKENSFLNVPYFLLDEARILDEVLTMGYPPIPGFDAILISETAHINSKLKAAIGKINGSGTAYLDNQDYFLINAKVKGGNSGGPVINKKGYVVGILVNIPANPEDTKQLDHLGYGIATPSEEIQKILKKKEFYQIMEFENIEKGFKTNF